MIQRLTRETEQVNLSQHFIETYTMFWIFGKVLINHVQCWLEDSVEDSRNLGD